MTQNGPPTPPTSSHRWFRRRWLGLLAIPPLVLALASWWLTDPLGRPSSPSTEREQSATPASVPETTTPTTLAWPEGRLEGEPAKQLLLDCLLSARKRLERVAGYTATFHRQERIGGVLRPEQTLELKARPDPFAIYFKFLTPQPGKEVVFVQGRHDDKLIAHNGDWKDRLVPRLKLDPKGVLALADSRHPITEAGLGHLTDRLIGFRRLDLADPEAVTVLDRNTDDQGREWFRAVHSHPHHHPDRPFARVEVGLDPKTFLPLRITSFDWPSSEAPGVELQLAERYSYDELDLDAHLQDLDFDPANPAYGFSRY